MDISSIKARAEATLTDPATTLADYKVAADSLKALAEYEKSSTDTDAQAKLLRYESVKSLSTGIVPLLTLLTLAITVYFQLRQAQITVRANEDAQWKTVIETMTTKEQGPTTDLAMLAGLIPFYDSERYRAQAYEIVFLLTNRLSNTVAFETIFQTAFISAGWGNAEYMTRLHRMLRDSFARADQEFERLGGQGEIDARSKLRQKRQATSKPDELEKISHARDEILSEKTFLANQVGKLFRQPRPTGALPYNDFSTFDFFEADLSKADLSGLNLNSAVFQRANVDGATLEPKAFSDSYWNGTKWWKAAKISGPLLEYLMKDAAPYSRADEFYLPEGRDAPQMERADYIKALKEVCAAAHVDCDLEHAPFGRLADDVARPK